ncbi:DUF4214 domain-containing protein [Candidatus Contendibacter odensensis]|uniref:DUF4214 domain-containing protein n=1 Tax=Candidatus Contendibacter odensensis TaxID=1400860 RepID=UPI0018A97C8D|nr:DUF4214 domain-containing protein [Candidatus Contendobacter odensis]
MSLFSSLSIVQAATFTVTTLNDSGAGSLRQAVIDANANLGTDTIAFQAGLTGTITLTSGEIQITDILTLNGPGASVLAISGNQASRIFYATSAMSGKALTINQLTLKNGIYGGSGIYSVGSRLTVNQCVLSDNKEAGLYAVGGAVVVNNSTFSGNSNRYAGGGLAIQDAPTVVNDSTFISNSAGDYGGGIIARTSNLTVNNSTLAYNSAVNWGGGIASYDSTVTLNNSTVFGNSASGGGGIATGYYGNTRVNNSTVSGNSATTGGGMSLAERGASYTVTLANSIVAGNSAATGKEIYRTPENTGIFTSLGHNLFGESGADGLVNVTKAATDLVLPGAIATAIGDLANNGGPTQTLLPVAGSLAIDHGDNALIPAGVTTDQRGVGFPRIVNTTVDIGAVEAGTLPPAQALIESYYQTILGRTPDAAGVAYWKSETNRTQRLGLDIKDVFRVMAGIFFTSAEYLNRPALLASGEIHLLSTGDAQYITDLYRTFFQRDPDPDGLSYWTQPLAEGLPRSMVLYNFVFSKEFDGTMQKQFGDTPARSEDATIGDFYRGYLNRLPDDDGFAFWQGRFRTAQCTNADAVRAEVESISNQFQAGTEYATRQRSPGDYVSDLYYAFLRRGGDLAGYNYWVNQISSQSATRDQVRQAFVNSSEFQTRVSQIIDQGCAP